MINYSYIIQSKPIALELNNYNNVILASTWTYKGIDDINGKSATIQTTTFFPNPFNSPDFIPYDEITDEIIFGWISEKEDLIAMQKDIENQIKQ